jgi:hypothetical protein
MFSARSFSDGCAQTYFRKTDKSASASGTKGDRIIDKRALLLCTDTAECDKADVKKMDPVIFRMLKSFGGKGDCRNR